MREAKSTAEMRILYKIKNALMFNHDTHYIRELFENTTFRTGN